MRTCRPKPALALTAVLAVVTTVLAPGSAGADNSRHRVRAGETLIDIAAANGTTVRALAQANGITDINRIVVGQVLVLPGAGGGATAASGSGVHVVAKGETLFDIARRYGTTTAAIATANGLRNASLLLIGQRLSIPGRATTGTAGATPNTPAAPAAGVHVVKAGETLVGIARRYGTSAAAIAAVNGLRNANLVLVGQRLSIPGSGGGTTTAAPGGGAYSRTGGGTGRTGVSGTVTVAPGDTLEAIAARYRVGPIDLAAANGLLPPYRLYATMRLFLSAPNRLPTDLATCPVPGAKFTNDFGFPRADSRFHAGNDMLAPTGTPVRAPAGGTVSYFTGSIGGNQFRLRGDDGTHYIGTHLSAFGTAGRVRVGDVIGYVGATGNAANGPSHLHFEVHPDGGAAMNPYPLLRAACG